MPGRKWKPDIGSAGHLRSFLVNFDAMARVGNLNFAPLMRDPRAAHLQAENGLPFQIRQNKL